MRAMFGRIAGRYDLLNRLLSAGVDRRWRRRAVRRVGPVGGRRVLDVCCGTADLALDFERAGARVVGVDFTFEMLRAAEPKLRGAQAPLLVQADALSLPVGDARFDAACVAFGIRNVADRTRGLAEMARVVRPGGTVLVLEFSMPPGRLFGALYRLYFTRLLPIVGGLVSGDRGAYEYLPETVLAWPDPDELQRELEALGLVECGYERLTGGIACLHHGRVGEGART